MPPTEGIKMRYVVDDSEVRKNLVDPLLEVGNLTAIANLARGYNFFDCVTEDLVFSTVLELTIKYHPIEHGDTVRIRGKESDFSNRYLFIYDTDHLIRVGEHIPDKFAFPEFPIDHFIGFHGILNSQRVNVNVYAVTEKTIPRLHGGKKADFLNNLKLHYHLVYDENEKPALLIEL